MWFLDHAWLIPLIPALSFFVILLLGKKVKFDPALIGIASVGASLVLSLGALVQWVHRVNNAEGGSAFSALGRSLAASVRAGGEKLPPVEPVVHHITWFQSGGVKFGAGIQIDGLAVMMACVVTIVSFLVHVYSTEYMKGDRRYTYFFAALSLFTASMLTLVVADNTLQLMIGWELVGVCSFMLIGHWWEEKPNSDAAIKAFLTTRTGDIGLIIGVIITFFGAGTFNIVDINTKALNGQMSHLVLLMGAIALFVGVMGKSGQFPLHTWLPDAMAGPTPVSALIHAATMVVAGVYLVARLYPVFWQGFSINAGGINMMAAIGGTTIVIAAALAFVQNDIKKVLAYSTISQLGYMVMGLGCGAWTAAVFHLFTHAFFKANLFLGAGSVSHSGSHHSFDMKHDMGGLRKYMPVTFWTFIAGTAALAGLPPFAGFWSKGEILANANHNSYVFFMVVGLVGAFMTAAYMTRCVYLTFFGEYRGHAHPHESPNAITVPLIVLGVLSVVAGFLNFPWISSVKEKFTDWFEPRVAFPDVLHASFNWTLEVISVVFAVGAILLVFYLYENNLEPVRGLTERNRFARLGYVFLVNKYYLDDLYERVIRDGIKIPIARASYWVNQNVIDAIVNGIGTGARDTGRFVYRWVDQAAVDGLVNGSGLAAEEGGQALRTIQTGKVQQYGALLFGAAAVVAFILVLVI